MSFEPCSRSRPDRRRIVTTSKVGLVPPKGPCMVRLGPERVLLIGDSQRNLQSALLQAMPAAHITAVPNYFEAIAELSGNQYTAVLASAEPIERRPEAAV